MIKQIGQVKNRLDKVMQMDKLVQLSEKMREVRVQVDALKGMMESFVEAKVKELLQTKKRPVVVKIKKLENFEGELPEYQSHGASGFDIRAQIKEPMILSPGERGMVPTGLSFEIPEGYEMQVRPRSGLAVKHGISVVNSPGTVDADYRGEVKVILINLGQVPFTINKHERIAQCVIAPVVQAELVVQEELSDTERGAGGFGSTGV